METHQTASLLPRPSRLPLPKPLYRPPSPTKQCWQPGQSDNETVSKHSQVERLHNSPRIVKSFATLRQPVNHSRVIGDSLTIHNKSSHISARQLLTQLRDPCLKQEPASTSTFANMLVPPRGTCHIAQQDIASNFNFGTDEGHLSSSSSPTDTGSQQSNLQVKSHPSLSDRAIESLSHLPASPAVNRRRSSFFNPQSPMTPNRPHSVTALNNIPQPCYEIVRNDASKKLASTFKKPLHPTSSGRSVSTSFISSLNAAEGARGSANYSKPPWNAGRVGKQVSAKSATASFSTNAAKRSHQPATSELSPTTLEERGSSEPTAGSAALKQKIAQARSESRAKLRMMGGANAVVPEFQGYDNPFNQKIKKDNHLLLDKIDRARRDGRLNIAAMRLNHIPIEVLNMYEAEAMEKSSIPWNETIDLISLNAAENEIADIGDEVFSDTEDESLSAEEFTKGSQFRGITMLDLHGNRLNKMPLGMRRLQMLKILNLSRNKLDNHVFDVISMVESLQILRMAENELSRELPESIGRLRKLEVLELNGNKLSLLPSCLRELQHLRILDVSGNRFSAFPMDSLADLPVNELYLSNNALTGALCSSSVQVLPHLQVLEVANNAIGALSFSEHLQLPALHHLDVSNNRLFALPDVSQWPNLLTLLAEDNVLTQLPQGFTALRQLKSANFKGNDIRTVEPEIARMQKLEVLVLTSNPLKDRRFASMTTEEVKRDLSNRLRPEHLEEDTVEE